MLSHGVLRSHVAHVTCPQTCLEVSQLYRWITPKFPKNQKCFYLYHRKWPEVFVCIAHFSNPSTGCLILHSCLCGEDVTITSIFLSLTNLLWIFSQSPHALRLEMSILRTIKAIKADYLFQRSIFNWTPGLAFFSNLHILTNVITVSLSAGLPGSRENCNSVSHAPLICINQNDVFRIGPGVDG